MATRQLLADLVAAYRSRTGCDIAIESVGGVNAARRVRAGERQDVVVLASAAMAQLEVEGHIATGSRADVARSRVAVAIPAGAPRPRIDDAADVKHAIVNARAVCYSTGPSGDHLKRLCQHWGIAGLVLPRAVQAPAGVPVSAVLARCEADLGFQQLSELLDAPGIEILGPLPAEAEAITVFTAGVASASQHSDEAHAFVAYLASPEADAAKLRCGMEPADRTPAA